MEQEESVIDVMSDERAAAQISYFLVGTLGLLDTTPDRFPPFYLTLFIYTYRATSIPWLCVFCTCSMLQSGNVSCRSCIQLVARNETGDSKSVKATYLVLAASSNTVSTL